MRASDADRDRAVRILRDAVVDGRLTQDSFVRRIDLALRARDHRSLAGVVADLGQPRAGFRLTSGLAAFTDRLARRRERPLLGLPDAAAPVVLVGRSRRCDHVIDEPTVSRVHAALMLFGGQWFVADRGSTNGTWVNGRRIWDTASVRPGDRVSFGQATFRLTAPADVQRQPSSGAR